MGQKRDSLRRGGGKDNNVELQRKEPKLRLKKDFDQGEIRSRAPKNKCFSPNNGR